MRPLCGLMHCTAILLFGGPLWLFPASAQTTQRLFDQLPRQTQADIRQVREWCTNAGTPVGSEVDTGLQEIDLNGDGSHDIVIDWQRVACGDAGGGGCSNRGCDLDIYKQTGRASWKKIFSEHVGKHFMSTTYDDRSRFRLLAISVVGGNSQCKINQNEPGARRYCDALVYWRQGRWQWEPIR
jgi:hypothetical protein